MADTTSRLLVKSTTLRETLLTRNLYSPDVEYPLNPNTVQKVVNAISSVASVLMPFKGFDLKSLLVGRLANSSPLTEISTILLGKQFAMNSMSHLVQETLPSINISNLFDKNKATKLFTKNIDYKITKKEQSKFKNFIDDLKFWYPMKDNPFNNNPTNDDYIKNTSTAQIGFLYGAINKNFYKQNNTVLYEYATKAGTQINDRVNLSANKIYFNPFNNPYLNLSNLNLNIKDAVRSSNEEMNFANITTSKDDNSKQEYAPNADFINNNFGQTSFNNKKHSKSDLNRGYDINNWIDEDVDISNTKNLVWGRDGTSIYTDQNLTQLQGISEEEVKKNLVPLDFKIGFNIKTGLLEYTRNLINANVGQIGDITRKAFINGDKLVGFNGSPLWRAPNNHVLPEFKGRTGIRQHTVLDQYNRFAKAIRFNGNIVYGGNVDSVTYKSVLPRIHPTIDVETGKMNNKNMMLSLENLAIRVISKDTYGIIDDEYGTAIPASEVGPFNGRIMWFPPYDLTVNETATAKYEPTVIIGRNEPMYNYQNSERSATLNFTLLIDYPQHLRNYKGQNKNREIAEFFAFGGDPYADKFISVDNLEAKLVEEIKVLEEPTVQAEPEVLEPTPVIMVFPNDEPKIGTELTYVNRLYDDLHYEININGGKCISSDGTGFGLNKDIFFVTGLTNQPGTNLWTLDPTLLPAGFSQYSETRISDQFGNEALINKVLKYVYSDINNRKLYDINIEGHTSLLYTELNKLDIAEEVAYNKALGDRRAEAAMWFIDDRLATLFQYGADQLGITINTTSTGSEGADSVNATALAIPSVNTKSERSVTIKIIRNNKTIEPKKQILTEDTKKAVQEKQKEIEAIQTKIRKLKDTNSDILNERGIDDGILNGFKSVSDNKFYPVFHSQTPEDFHKRLTFLQQCTRQGAAIRSDAKVDDNGILRARNSVFGRQPICILRVGDFFYTKVIIESVNIDYVESTWDTNPENFGVQPLQAKVTLNMKLIGGQSLKGPIDALQNAVSFNYYANSTFTDTGVYKTPSNAATAQETYINGVLAAEQISLINNFNKKVINNAQIGINSLF